jgi:hypothetical protein
MLLTSGPRAPKSKSDKNDVLDNLLRELKELNEETYDLILVKTGGSMDGTVSAAGLKKVLTKLLKDQNRSENEIASGLRGKEANLGLLIALLKKGPSLDQGMEEEEEEGVTFGYRNMFGREYEPISKEKDDYEGIKKFALEAENRRGVKIPAYRFGRLISVLRSPSSFPMEISVVPLTAANVRDLPYDEKRIVECEFWFHVGAKDTKKTKHVPHLQRDEQTTHSGRSKTAPPRCAPKCVQRPRFFRS